MNLRNTVALLSLVFFLTGCSTTITNLTPASLPRNDKNLYPFEVEFETTQQSVRENTIKPYVMVGTEKYPMEKTPMLENRYEAMVPVAPTNNYIYYRYRFDYEFDRIPKAGQSSRLSPTYQLHISE